MPVRIIWYAQSQKVSLQRDGKCRPAIIFLLRGETKSLFCHSFVILPKHGIHYLFLII